MTTTALSLPPLWPEKRASRYTSPSQWPAKADDKRRLEAKETMVEGPRKPVQWLSIGPAAADDGWDLSSTAWPSKSTSVPLASRRKPDGDSAAYALEKGAAALLEHLRAPPVPRALPESLSRMMTEVAAKSLSWAPIITGFAPRNSGILGRIEKLRQKVLEMHEELRQSRALFSGVQASYTRSLQEVQRPFVPLPIEDQVDDRFAPDTSLQLPSVTAPATPPHQGSRYVHKRHQALALAPPPVRTVDLEWSLTEATSNLAARA